MAEKLIRAVGIDPGAVTGIVCITLPAQSRDLSRAAWVGSVSVIRRAARVDESHAESQARFFRDVYESVLDFDPELAIIEEPSDAMVGGWNKSKGGKAGPPTQGRQVAFGLGAAYMTALSAIACLERCERIESYLVSGSKKRSGWMPKVRSGNLTHTISHVQLAQFLCGEIIELSRDRSFAEKDRHEKFVRDDELMAFGILRYHILAHGAA